MPSRILIVEDEMLIALTYKIELTGHGHEILDICVDVDTALDRIKAGKPDFVLVDIHLQGKKDGIQLVTECKEMAISAKFIFITGNFDFHTRSRAEALNPLGFYVKPVLMSEILKLVS